MLRGDAPCPGLLLRRERLDVALTGLVEVVGNPRRLDLVARLPCALANRGHDKRPLQLAGLLYSSVATRLQHDTKIPQQYWHFMQVIDLLPHDGVPPGPKDFAYFSGIRTSRRGSVFVSGINP